MKIISLTLLLAVVLFASCKKEDSSAAQQPDLNSTSSKIEPGNEEMDVTALRSCNHGISTQTVKELQRAHAATARYRKIENAFKDQYADINVVVPNMGYHFMKSAIVNATFEIDHPEILVYNKNEDGKFELVAVEYAVPLDQSSQAPEGFTGSRDVWERNEGFGLWLLHAWVWKHNPDGVFHDTNPLVQVH